MAKQDVAKFFASVYEDKSLAGALHYALAKTAPNLIVEIAKSKGYNFTNAEIDQLLGGGGQLSDQDLAQVSGGAFNLVRNSALSSNIWSSVRSGLGDNAFGLTIPGPAFVNVMSAEKRNESEAEALSPAPSASELYNDLTA